jgi:hypothetical protein
MCKSWLFFIYPEQPQKECSSYRRQDFCRSKVLSKQYWKVRGTTVLHNAYRLYLKSIFSCALEDSLWNTARRNTSIKLYIEPCCNTGLFGERLEAECLINWIWMCDEKRFTRFGVYVLQTMQTRNVYVFICAKIRYVVLNWIYVH